MNGRQNVQKQLPRVTKHYKATYIQKITAQKVLVWHLSNVGSYHAEYAVTYSKLLEHPFYAALTQNIFPLTFSNNNWIWHETMVIF